MRFAAVRTTGVYCRPSCGGNPSSTNVERYGVAAAAESAGYRSCLRCRPYRVSDVPLWPDGPELVCRAVRLILAGVLDSGSEAALAGRLGVSGRHLRRLFAQHLGVTPDALARSARAHFARRLLDDTELPMTQIAFAAGFGSLRQFNRAFAEVFRDTPSALRAKRRRSDRLVADGGLALRLPYEGPLDWEALLAHLCSHAIPGVEAVDGERYRRTVAVDGDPGVLELAPGGQGELRLVAHLPHWEGLIHHVRRARMIASLDLDVLSAADLLARDPALAPLVAARPGLRPAGTWDPFEVAVAEIAATHVGVKHRRRALATIVEHFGDTVPGLQPIGLTHVFPSPQRLAAEHRAPDGLPDSAWMAIRTLAAGVADGSVDLEGGVPLDELRGALMAIPGVSSDLADYVALRAGERDAFPARGRDSERWAPWRAVAAAHLQAARATARHAA